MRLGATPTRVLPSGYKFYRGVAGFGDVVLEYPEDGVSEFVPAREALSPEAIESTIGVPFTILHPDEMLSADDEDYLQQHTVGTVVNAEANWQADPPELIVDVVVHTASAQEAVESGRVADLSLGYDRDPVRQVGEFKGKPYQIVQKNRRSNHLSGVRTARSTTPDGRRARLDEADVDATPSTFRRDETLAPGEVVARLEIEFGDGIAWARTGEQSGTVAPPPPSWLEALAQARHFLVPADDLGDLPPVPRSDAGARARAGAHYARLKMEDDILSTPPGPTRKDADAPPPPAADSAKTDAPEAEPAAALGEVAALADLAPEDAEILKTLSAEGQAVLVAALKGLQAEKAEQAIMAAPVGGEESEEVEDASTPAAPQALTMDMVNAAIADAMAKMGGPKKDAAPAPKPTTAKPATVSPTEVRPAGAIDLDDSVVRKHVTDAQRADESFVAAARKDSHVGEGATVRQAAQAMHAVIVAHLPKLADAAKADLAAGRRDSFLRVYEAAEDVRRSALLDDQQSIFAEFARGSVADDAATADALSIFSRSGGSAA